MLTKCKILGCNIEIDMEQTARWYAQAEDWGCDCEDCRRFLDIAKEGKLPSRVTKLLDDLHIPPTKATYVCLLNGENLYQFSYRVAGNILSVETDWEDDGHCCHEIYPYGAPDFPVPHFDIEFFIDLP